LSAIATASRPGHDASDQGRLSGLSPLFELRGRTCYSPNPVNHMLKPYLAVIRDSFRAATHSRVLYIVLGLILLVLLLLAPFHVRQTLDWKLSRERNFPAPDRLVRRLVEEGKTGARPAVAHIWQRLSPELQADLVNEAAASAEAEDSQPRRRQERPGGNPAERRLLEEFNALLEEDDLYDETAFAGKRLTDEASQLIEKADQRSTAEDRRLNRLLLCTALRRDVAMPGETQLDFYYFNWHWRALTANLSHATFASNVTSQLPTYFDKFIMSIGIFIAILITASIIPEMLEPGSLNLLLSKPVHRWGLLLAKYVGGCVFILLCASLFFVGLWLWMGIQLEIWEPAILLSIPTYVFVFGMYYAVSVLAGIWFRSPVICITLAVLFWAICSVIGYAYAWLDYRHYNAAARQLAACGDDVLMVDLLQQHLAWDPVENAWRNPSRREMSPEEEGGFVFASFIDRLDEFPDMPGPAVDRQTDRFLMINNGIVDALSNSRLRLVSANPQQDWQVANRGPLPSGTVEVLWSRQFGQLTVDRSGTIFRWTGEEEPVATEAANTDESTGDGSDDETQNGEADQNPAGRLTEKISGFLNDVSRQSAYEQISDDASFRIDGPRAVSLNPQSDEIVFYSEGQLVRLAPDDKGRFQELGRQRIGDHNNNHMTAFVATAGRCIFVMLGNGRFYHLDTRDGSVIHTVDLSDQAAIRCLAASPDGQFAAVTLRSGELWIYDATSQSRYKGFGISGLDNMACTFDEQGRLWVGDRFQSATCYDLESGRTLISRKPESGWFTVSFRLVIRPLHRFFPKPGEFYKLVTHLASAGDARGNPDIDLTRLPHRDDPWSPLKSGIVFTTIVLAISCLVFQREDF
jgi:hypothetical protein